MRQYSAPDFSGFYYAHRGLYDNHHGVPENSLPAFRAAAEKGYGVELDVQLSADGQAQHIKKQRHHFADKGPHSQNYSFSSTDVTGGP